MVRVRTVAKLIGLSVIAVLVGVSLTPIAIKADTSLSVSTVTLPGLSSNVNNVAFAFGGKYSVVAPFETSDPANQAPFEGDNHYLVVTEVRNPSHVFKLDLVSNDAQPWTCYYPTHLIVSSNDIAFVRATACDSLSHIPIAEVIAVGHLILDKDANTPRFDGAIVPIKINRFVATADPGAIPTGFGVSKAGGYLVFTNGAQVFSVDLVKGDTYTVQPVAQYGPLPNPEDPGASTADYETIASLEVDSNNVVSVGVSGRRSGNDFSRLFFYGLREGIKHPGTMDLLAMPVDSGQLSGAQIAPGSLAAVSVDRTTGYFATTDGWLWGVELKDSPSLNLTRLRHYASISGHSGYEAGPRDVRIDASGSALSIVKQGATVNIRRPSYGRHGGGIRRPSYSKYDEVPGFVLVHLNENGSVGGDTEIQTHGLGNGVYAISNAAFTEDGGAYVAASYWAAPGILKLLDKTGVLNDLPGAVPDNIGQIVSADGSTMVGIESFDVSSGPGASMTKGGGLVVMSLRTGADAVVSSASRRAAIRRPCNVNH